MTAPGVQDSETIFKTIDLTEEIGWGKINDCKVVSHQQIAAEEQRKWNNRSSRGGVDAEEKRTDNRTLGNTRGNVSKCRGVISNGECLRVISKIGFKPMKPKLVLSRLRRMARSMLSKAALRSRETRRVEFPESDDRGKNVVVGCKKTSFSRMTRPIRVLRLVEVW